MNDVLLLPFMNVLPLFMAVLFLVQVAGASRVMFDVIGTFQAKRLITDAKAASTVFQSIMLDAIMGVQDAAVAIGDQMTALVDATVPVAKEIEEARIQMEKFISAGEDVDVVSAEVEKIGLDFGFAADEAFRAAAKMAQLSGVLGSGTMGAGTEMGMAFGLISDMETEAAMQRMVNLQQQTNFMTKNITENMTAQQKSNAIRRDTMEILDQLNTIENRSVATMEQITFVMNQFASQAHLAGQSIASMAAMSATLIEAGEEQGKGGRALRMIYARLGANTSGAADAFHDLGIATRDSEGVLRSLSDIFRDLNEIYPQLNEQQRMDLAQKVAGNRHYTRFLKLSENYTRTLELEFEALIRLSPALEEIERRQNSNVFALQRSEAQVKKYSAAIGEALMPSLTLANEKQAMFNREVAGLLTGPLESFITPIFAAARGMQNIVGPVLALQVNVQMLSVAMNTYRTILGALNNEQIINQHAYGNSKDQYISGTSIMFQYNQSLEDINANLKVQTLNLKELSVEEQRRLALKISQDATEIDGINQRASILNTANEAMEQSNMELGMSIDINKQKIKDLNNSLIENGMDQFLVTEAVELAEQAINEDTLAIERNNAALIENGIELEKLGAKIDEHAADKHRLAAGSTAYKARIKAESRAEMDLMSARVAAQTRFAMGIAATGSAMMLFSKNQTMMRAGMILNTVAILAQVQATMLKTSTDKAGNVVTTHQLLLGKMQAAIESVVTTLKNAHAKANMGIAASATAAATALKAQGAAAVASLGPYAALAGLAYVLASAFGTVFSAGKDLAEQTNDLDLSLYTASSEEVIAALKTENRTIKEQQDALEELKAERISLSESTNALDKQRIEFLDKEISKNLTILDITQARAMQEEGMMDTLKKVMETEKAIAQDGKLRQDLDPAKHGFVRGRENIYGTGIFERASGSASIHSRFAAIDAESEAMRKQLIETVKTFRKDFPEFYEEGGLFGKDGKDLLEMEVEDIIKILETRNETLEAYLTNAEMNNLGLIIDGYKEASAALTEFSNTREELFYGFSSENLTGNLVKQVVQQGVETLITTTEVIMTNTFNGMTTAEAANQILDEIERGAGLRGMNLS